MKDARLREFRCRRDGRFLLAELIHEGVVQTCPCPLCKTVYRLHFESGMLKSIEEVPRKG
mgnify:CR=1 FL=1